MHFWSFSAKYCHFLHILSNARPKTNVNKVPRWVFRYVGNKTFDFSSKKKDFLPKNNQIWPKTGIFGQFGPGLFSALLMGRLVVVARGLYLARHLFTLCHIHNCHGNTDDKSFRVSGLWFSDEFSHSLGNGHCNVILK